MSKMTTNTTGAPHMAQPRFNLTAPEAIERMESELEKMRAQPRGELHDMDPDTAFEKGYEVALFDLRSLTGPRP